MERICHLADQYDFDVVCDDTIDTFVHCDLLPYTDIVVTSLTKFFSGGCKVMGGTWVPLQTSTKRRNADRSTSATVNPLSTHHDLALKGLKGLFVDTYFPNDLIIMEQNSRDLAQRVHGINSNPQKIAELLQSHPPVRKVYHPALRDTKAL